MSVDTLIRPHKDTESFDKGIIETLVKSQPKVLVLPTKSNEIELPKVIGNYLYLPIHPNPQKNPNLKLNKAYYLLEGDNENCYIHHVRHLDSETMGNSVYLLGHRYIINEKYIPKRGFDFWYADLIDFGFIQIKPSILMEV